ncbi:MAG: thioredoxin family protein [Desulfovibrio sp.]|jgi:thiol:disulfide interchange protein DsbD|nr:thioredoxin family protein [Desulfovibrio sp.]
MRVFLGLFLFFCLGCGQGWTRQADECPLTWQGFLLDAPETVPAPVAGNGTEAPAALLAFTLQAPPGMYLYGQNSREGLPTAVDVTFAPADPFAARGDPGGPAFAALLREKGVPLPVRLPPAVPRGATAFASVPPQGARAAGVPIFVPPLTFWVEIPAFAPFYASAALRVTVTGLLCSATSCAPLDTRQDLVLDLALLRTFPPAASQDWWPEFQEGRAVQLPVREPGAGPEAGASPPGDQPAGTAPEEADPAGIFALFAAFSPLYFHPSLEVEGWGEALFFGLLAGLLLNLMPCVLPVISLKFTALMAVSAMDNMRERAVVFRRHCLIFAAGILSWFLVLALLLGTAGWAWGELFQTPQVLALLALILFLLSLSLFGVFSLPVLDPRVRGGSPRLQTFLSGLLATLLATPCSGPLLGGVLGWALRQPLAVLMLTVGSVGLGMALPYAALAASPRLVNLLPRPGPWTLRLEQILGFFLLGSVVYLTALLPDLWVLPFLSLLLCLAVGAWLWGQIGHPGASPLQRGLARTLAALLVLGGLCWGEAAVEEGFSWEPFDPRSFARSLGREPMLLEFTADWCPNCKVMEHTTLNGNRMTVLRDRYKMRTIKVDLSRGDPVAKGFLRALGSGSIPLIALFPPGEASRTPLVLRDIVTPAQLEDALERTF